jgi:hypothetical protein
LCCRRKTPLGDICGDKLTFTFRERRRSRRRVSWNAIKGSFVAGNILKTSKSEASLGIDGRSAIRGPRRSICLDGGHDRRCYFDCTFEKGYTERRRVRTSLRLPLTHKELRRYGSVHANSVWHEIRQDQLDPVDGSGAQESITLVNEVEKRPNHESDKEGPAGNAIGHGALARGLP